MTPTRSVGSNCKETAVSEEVMFAMKIAMITRPNRIQMIEKIRATIDFGALSPYLKQKENRNEFMIILYELASGISIGSKLSVT